jgi:hypothetical protein
MNLSLKPGPDSGTLFFPDTVRNGRSVDAFFWNGYPKPTPVQRMGAWMVGLFFISFGAWCLVFAAGARDTDHDWFAYWTQLLISLASFSAGIRIFRNGFPRNRKND